MIEESLEETVMFEVSPGRNQKIEYRGRERERKESGMAPRLF